MARCIIDNGWISRKSIPLDFNSSVQPLRSSCTSSGSTVLRVHASSHRGFGGASLAVVCCAPFFLDTLAGPSLPFSLEKKLGIVFVLFLGTVVLIRRDAFNLQIYPLQKSSERARLISRSGRDVEYVIVQERMGV